MPLDLVLGIDGQTGQLLFLAEVDGHPDLLELSLGHLAVARQAGQAVGFRDLLPEALALARVAELPAIFCPADGKKLGALLAEGQGVHVLDQLLEVGDGRELAELGLVPGFLLVFIVFDVGIALAHPHLDVLVPALG